MIKRVLRELGLYAQMEDGSLVKRDDPSVKYSIDSGVQNIRQPYSSWHPIHSDRGIGGDEGGATVGKNYNYKKPSKEEEGIVRWGYLEWFADVKSCYQLAIARPGNYWYEFEIFGEIFYIQTDNMSPWVTGCGTWAEVFKQSVLSKYLNEKSFPNPRPQIDDIVDPEEETPSDHFQFILGEAAEETFRGDGVYETRWEWIGDSTSPLFENYFPADMPDLYVEGPMYPEVPDFGSLLSGRIYYIYPRPVHNTYNKHYNQDIDTDGEHAFFQTEHDIYFEIYTEMGDHLNEVKEDLETWQVEHPASYPNYKDPTLINDGYDFKEIWGFNVESVQQGDDPENTIDVYTFTITLESDYHVDIYIDGTNTKEEVFSGSFTVKSTGVPAKFILIYHNNEESYEIELSPGETFEFDFTMLVYAWYDYVYMGYTFEHLESITGTGCYFSMGNPLYGKQPYRALCIIVPDVDEEHKNEHILTPTLIPIKFKSLVLPSVRDYDQLLFTKEDHAITVYDNVPLRYDPYVGSFESRRSTFFSKEAWDKVIHNDWMPEPIDDIRALYVQDLTEDDFEITQEEEELEDETIITWNVSHLYHIFPPMYSPYIEVEQTYNEDEEENVFYTYESRGIISIDFLPNYALYQNTVLTFPTWNIPFKQLIDTIDCTMKVLVSGSGTINVKGAVGLYDLSDEEDYELFLENAVEAIFYTNNAVVVGGNRGYEFSGQNKIWRQHWYDRVEGGVTYYFFTQHVCEGAHAEFYIYPKKGTYSI